MRKITARKLLAFPYQDLWNILTGEFILVFDDGELQTNAFETLYSAFAWEFHREYPATPLLKRHHAREIIKEKRLGADTHSTLLGNVMRSAYEACLTPEMAANEEAEHEIRDRMAEKIYRTSNLMYNELIIRCEEYVTSLDIVDFLECLDNPQIKEINENIQETQRSIESGYQKITGVLMTDPALDRNPLALACRSRLVSMGQVHQCISVRGILTDVDGIIFPKPVMRGYAMGFRSIYDSLVESRSSAKSLLFSKTPLQQTEYFSRRLQLMSQIVRNLHLGDCGTTEYLMWKVRPAESRNGKSRSGDLGRLVGKKYLDDDGSLKTITMNDQHLIGKTLKLRSVMHCAHPDQYGVCTTCFGDLSYSVPARTNIGQYCCTWFSAKASQVVLSTKHLDNSSAIDGITLEDWKRQWLKVATDENSYMLAERLRGKNVKLVISPENASNLTDVYDAKSIEDLNIVRVSELSTVGIWLPDTEPEPMPIVVSVGRRLPSMTYDLLHYVRATGWTHDKFNNFVIDLKDWDWSKSILTLPLRHINMSDHSRDIAAALESSVDKMKERDQYTSRDAALGELYDLVNEQLDINLAVLDVVVHSISVVSAENGDYSLPKPWTTNGLGVMKLSMANRSLSAAMAYQEHRDIIVDPNSYTRRNRPNHLFDGLLMPYEVLMASGKYGFNHRQ